MNELVASLEGRWPWAVGLALGLPLALVALNELVIRLSRRGHALVSSARWFRAWVVPFVALHLYLRYVALRPETDVLPRLAATLAWFTAIVGAIGLVNSLFFEAAEAGTWRSKVPGLLRDLVRLLLVAAGAALVYAHVWGREITGALTALGVTSIVVGLALQEPLGNLFSGLMLLMERPFELGESIAVGSASGIVKEINWRSVHLVDPSTGETTIVPNSILNKETLRNFSRPRPMHLGVIEVGFSYDDPPNDVREALLELARETEGVLPDPPPLAVTDGYGDHSIRYKLIYRTAEADRWKVRNLLTTRLWYVAQRRGFTLPFPVRVNIDHARPGPYGKAVPEPAELIGRFPRIPQVAALAENENASLLRFATGETIFDEGDPLEGIYLVASGAVSLQLAADGRFGEIGTVGAGEFFAETAMHGRAAAEMRAVAALDSEIVRIAPETVRQLFELNPRLARDTGQSLDARRKAVQSARRALRS